MCYWLFYVEQREGVQKKTFTKWVNSHLVKGKENYHIEDLYVDLQDGKALLKLLEILSGERMVRFLISFQYVIW